jgi:hypothetical protein
VSPWAAVSARTSPHRSDVCDVWNTRSSQPEELSICTVTATSI